MSYVQQVMSCSTEPGSRQFVRQGSLSNKQLIVPYQAARSAWEKLVSGSHRPLLDKLRATHVS